MISGRRLGRFQGAKSAQKVHVLGARGDQEPTLFEFSVKKGDSEFTRENTYDFEENLVAKSSNNVIC